MKKIKLLTALLLALSFIFLTACNGEKEAILCTKCNDLNDDGICDKCGGSVMTSNEKTNTMGTGACAYATSRNISGRDITYVEICFENYGRCVVLLDATTAPITVKNFLSLVESGYYNGLTMHRIIKDFMIQGGDPKANGTGGSGTNIIGEFAANGYTNDIPHIKGVISMARGGYSYNSASSQFFICNATSKSTTNLDGNYAAFGYVVEGLSVVDEITSTVAPKATDNNGTIQRADQPTIKYIKVLEDYQKSN